MSTVKRSIGILLLPVFPLVAGFRCLLEYLYGYDGAHGEFRAAWRDWQACFNA
jgi:hypothetical protein